MNISSKQLAAIIVVSVISTFFFCCIAIAFIGALSEPEEVIAPAQSTIEVVYELPTFTPEPTNTALPTSTPLPTPTIDPIKARQELIEKQFSVWNGSHKSLVEYTKLRMHNPDSFKHIETRYRDDGETLFLIMTFEGTNGFGATIRSQIKARAAVNTGSIIEVLE